MSKRIVVDPVTRIEGHLRIDVEVDGGRVVDAWSSGQMWRGIETILEGRDPREAWLFTQRICGVCTTVHALASVRAVENALGLEVPLNAQYIRNLILIAHALHDHIVHFYHLSALDWVDITAALEADPGRTAALGRSLSPWPGNSASRMAAAQQRLRDFVAGGRLGVFASGYWGHPAMKLPPEADLLAFSHYLEALEYQRIANQAVAILGGKTPHIQNLAVGGVANAVNLDNQATLNMEKLLHVQELLRQVDAFVKQVYLPDVVAIGSFYPEWLGYGAGVRNYLAVPDLPLDEAGREFDLPGGTLLRDDQGRLQVHPIGSFEDPWFRDNVSECIARSWYEGDWTRHPWEEETQPRPGEFEAGGAYSWVKAPRFQGRPMQVGPLAQVLIGHALGHRATVSWLNHALAEVQRVAEVQLGPEHLHSTLGRHLARAVRCAVLTDLAQRHWQLLVDNIGSGDTRTFRRPEFPKEELRGFGFHEAPRGTLSHWVVIRDGRIANYQCVVPSTWNAGPRDDKGQRGPYEESLLDNPVADPEQPLELLRTIHSFDPCLACAIHTHDPEGREQARVRVL